MLSILFFLFVIVFVVLSSGISFIKMLFGSGQSQNSYQYTRSERSQQQDSPRHKKVFDRNEGEYVDFEEVK
ncbi:MAG: DUF4834 family protein [Prevotella sp.]|nr:DUF4834 family protein [Prevotella sp.]